MTIIAWDGSTLAADSSRITFDIIERVTRPKVRMLEDGRAWGAAGRTVDIERFAQWVVSGGPPPQLVEPEAFSALVCVPSNEGPDIDCYLIEGDALSTPILTDGPQAIGAGREFALGVMHGLMSIEGSRDLSPGIAETAVARTCQVHTHCHGPVMFVTGIAGKWFPGRLDVS